jgi:hypothetical protein
MIDKEIKPVRSTLLQYRTWLAAFFQALLIFSSLVLAWLSPPRLFDTLSRVAVYLLTGIRIFNTHYLGLVYKK